MTTIRKGSQVTLFDNAVIGADPSAALEVSDSVASLTMYVVFPGDGSTATYRLETSTSDTFSGTWASLIDVSGSGPDGTNGTTVVGFAQGQVLFVRARATGGIGHATVVLVAR